MPEIRIDINNVDRQIDKLNDATFYLKRAIQIIDAEKSHISSYWKGNGATVFEKKLGDQREELYDLYRKITSVTSTIKKTAERIKRQEEAIIKASEKL